MKITRTGLSACAVAALLAGAVACTDEGGGGAAKKAPQAVGTACANGTYTWFNVDKRDVLTGVAAKQRLGKGGGALTNKPMPLHTPTTTVTFEKGPRVGAKAALRSLAVRIGDVEAAGGDASSFTDVHRPLPKRDAHPTTVDGAGDIVEYTFVRQVTADFRYTCGDGEHAAGRATGWIIDGTGILECSTAIKNAKPGEPSLEAARLSCGPDSPAATAKKA
ncbi:hypothetical protein [Streptomyces sp. NPDC004284]|uniref:hypothetical protein n=1 Tax=Streptomyces sp. NPDC004284 TaxID=3364695 RepID=UPI0036A7315E